MNRECSIGYEVRKTNVMRVEIVENGLTPQQLVDGLLARKFVHYGDNIVLQSDNFAKVGIKSVARILADDALHGGEYSFPRDFT